MVEKRLMTRRLQTGADRKAETQLQVSSRRLGIPLLAYFRLLLIFPPPMYFCVTITLSNFYFFNGHSSIISSSHKNYLYTRIPCSHSCGSEITVDSFMFAHDAICVNNYIAHFQTYFVCLSGKCDRKQVFECLRKHLFKLGFHFGMCLWRSHKKSKRSILRFGFFLYPIYFLFVMTGRSK